MNGIDGTAPDDIYVVGDAECGFAVFNKVRWEISASIPVSTLKAFAALRRYVHVCGRIENVLTAMGEGSRLSPKGTRTISGSWRSRADAYLAAKTGLLAYDATGDPSVRVNTGLSRRLGQASAEHDVGDSGRSASASPRASTGATSELIVHPDNRGIERCDSHLWLALDHPVRRMPLPVAFGATSQRERQIFA